MADDVTFEQFLKAPRVASAPAPDAEVTFDDFMKAPKAKPAAPQTPVDIGDDVGRGLLSGARDAVVGFPGMAADLMRGGDWVIDRAKTGIRSATGKSKADGTAMSTKEIDDEVRAERDGMRTAKERAGEAYNIAGYEMPTAKGIIKFANEKGLPGAYEPKTAYGRAANTFGSLAIPSIAGKGSAAQKGLGAILGTAGNEGLGAAVEALPDDYKQFGAGLGIRPEEVDAGARMAGTAAGIGAGRAVGPDNATQRLEKRLGKALNRDQKLDEMPMTPEQAATIPGAIGANVAGPETRGAMRAAGATSDRNLESLIGINDAVAAQKAGAPGAIAGSIDESIGKTTNAAAARAAATAAKNAANDANYQAVMALPHAQNVWTPELADMMRRVPSDVVLQAEKLAKVDGKPGLIMPVWQEATPAVPHKILWQNGKWVNTGGTPGKAAGWVPGPGGAPNLEFWDYLKKALYDKAHKLPDDATGKTMQGSLEQLRRQLVAKVDGLVPEYGTTRSIAADLFGDISAVEQGYAYFGRLNAFKAADVQRAVAAMTPDQRANFAEGFASRLKDDVASGSLGKTLARFDDPAFRAKMDLALPPEVVRDILGRASAERLKALAKPTTLQAPGDRGPGLVAQTMASGAMGALGHALEYLNTGTTSFGGMATFTGAGLAATTWGLGRAAKRIWNERERKVGTEILRLMRSDRPEDFARLGEIMQKDKTARSVMTQLTNAAEYIAKAGYAENAQQEPPPLTIRPGRKAGGRVKASPFDAAADALIAMVEQARAGHASTTESLLQAPDEHIVHALHVASKHT